MATQEEIDAQISLLEAHRRNLFLYLRQQAKFGYAYAPPIIINGIHECREDIDRIKQNLRNWAVIVDDHPDDGEPLTDPDEPYTNPSRRYNGIQFNDVLPLFLNEINILFGGVLEEKLFRGKDHRKDVLLDIFSQIKSIEHSIDSLIQIIDLLSNRPGEHGSADSKVPPIIIGIQNSLQKIQAGLDTLSPGFEIMTKTAVNIMTFVSLDRHFVRIFLPRKASQEDISGYRSRLLELREQAEEVRENLADFIRNNYTWEDLGR